jgi:hypothetical protein
MVNDQRTNISKKEMKERKKKEGKTIWEIKFGKCPQSITLPALSIRYFSLILDS